MALRGAGQPEYPWWWPWLLGGMGLYALGMMILYPSVGILLSPMFASVTWRMIPSSALRTVLMWICIGGGVWGLLQITPLETCPDRGVDVCDTRDSGYFEDGIVEGR